MAGDPIISGGTKVVGIIGDPIAHTRSPAMHNAAFAALDLDFVYVPFRVRPGELAAAVQAVRALNLAGLNVTVPHKEAVVPLLDQVTPRAQLIGAVNTIYRRGERLIGDNTDGIGAVTALREAGHQLRGAKALVVGAGGAARAVVAGLIGAGASRVRVVNRNSRRRQALANHFAQRRRRIVTGPLQEMTDKRILADLDLVVNATSIGWHGERFPPLPSASTPERCLFFDLIYNTDTDFLRRAARAGRPKLDGMGMLLHQGAIAFRLWTRYAPPLEAMARALHGR